jgi:hypothetical protein
MSWNKNSGYGRAMLDGIYAALGGAFGNVFVVLDPDDYDESNFQHIQEIFGQDEDGRVRFFTSLDSAVDATESNNNDVIVLDGNSTHTLTEMLTVSNNRVHLVGLDYLLGIHRRVGQSTKVSLGVTTTATDIGTVKVTGVRCSFRGIKFINENTVAEGIYCFADGGEYTYMEDCEIYKSTDLDVTGAAELVANGDSSHYKNCWIGSLANEISGAVIRPCVTVTGGLAGTGKKLRDTTFEDCIFARKCGDVANRFVYGANATDVERMLLFKGCGFISNILGAATPALGVDFGSAQTQGQVIIDQNCYSVDVTALGATGESIYTLAPSSPTYATSGKAVAS